MIHFIRYLITTHNYMKTTDRSDIKRVGGGVCVGDRKGGNLRVIWFPAVKPRLTPEIYTMPADGIPVKLES